jgi:hypothetical protein
MKALRAGKQSWDEMNAATDSAFDQTKGFIKQFDAHNLGERLDSFGLNRTKRQILLLLAGHISHHISPARHH